MLVLLDSGHGIDTPGKRSVDGAFREYLWNRQVADYALAYIRRMGIPCELVVTETNDIPLKTRANRVNAICNREGASNVLLISIHSNACGNGSAWQNAKGWSAYTTRGVTKSDALAECMYIAFEREFTERKIRKDMTDGDSDYEENFYILQKTRCPAVLLENFFYDNREECRFLLQEDTKQRVAKAIKEGISIYLSRV